MYRGYSLFLWISRGVDIVIFFTSAIVKNI